MKSLQKHQNISQNQTNNPTNTRPDIQKPFPHHPKSEPHQQPLSPLTTKTEPTFRSESAADRSRRRKSVQIFPAVGKVAFIKRPSGKWTASVAYGRIISFVRATVDGHVLFMRLDVWRLFSGPSLLRWGHTTRKMRRFQ